MRQKTYFKCNPVGIGGADMPVQNGPKDMPAEHILDTDIVRAAVEAANGQIAFFTHRLSQDFESAAAAALEDDELCEIDEIAYYDVM